MKPEALHDASRFTPVWQIDHDRVAAELQPYLWRRSPVMGLYLTTNFCAVGLVALSWFRSGLGVIDGFTVLSVSMCLAYLMLVPMHEAVHGIAYRRLGAKSVRVRYLWRVLSAYCLADRFVVDKRGQAQVAIAPFLLLNPLLVLLACLGPEAWRLGFASAFLLHVGACSGDFALLNWLYLSKFAEVYTYDDGQARRTFFFIPRTSPESLP